ncbi:hypothetical protein [Herbaspirillum rubrisubalbicans]|uniref:hypothetical protein n=1 Tax=Herbaspirillum rubrisubalbicans TaxID=80842 RepID=UPI0012FD8B89|nr:hypothetical protein [Herbaspirillum rubrisubalbicans]
MTTEWNFLPSIISAASGLGGVWLGGYLTWRRESLREATLAAKESTYLIILVTAHLERFANECLHVAYDDGTIDGRPASGDYHSETVANPTFNPLTFDVDWKVLPSDLMYGILNLPYRNEQLINHLGSMRYDDPPDYTDYFWARQTGFAELGLEVSALCAKLRSYANLPAVIPKDGEWNRDDSLRKLISRIGAEKKAWQERIANFPRPSSTTSI